MTVHLNRRALPTPPPPTADDRRELREALKLRLYFLDRDIAEHEAGIASAESDQSPLGRREVALRSQLLPGLRAERRCVARRLDAITPEPPPAPVEFVPPIRPEKQSPPSYAELQAARRERARRFLNRREALRRMMR